MEGGDTSQSFRTLKWAGWQCVAPTPNGSLLLGSRLVPHKGWNRSQWGGPDAFQSGGVPWQKTLPKGILMLENALRPFGVLRWVDR